MIGMKEAKWILLSSLIAVSAQAKNVEDQVATSSSPTVSIDVDSGTIKVLTWDEDRVRIEGKIDDDVDEYEFKARSKDSVEIEVSYDDEEKSWGNRRADTRLTIYVPKKSSVSFESISAEFEIEKLDGRMSAETVNGTISAKEITGLVGVESVNGSIELLEIKGEIEIDSVNGSIKVEQTAGDVLDIESVNGRMRVKSTARDIEIQTVNGDTELEFGEVERIELEAVSGRIEAKAQLTKHAELSAETVSGVLKLVFIEPIDIDVSVESMTGDIINRITDDKAEKGSFGLNNKLKFQVGKASGEVEITTLSGEIVLDRESR